MKLKTISFFLFTILLAVILVVSCISGPVTIPEDITAMELIQRAQEASDRNRYSVSLEYYNEVLERFPYDLESICAAEYEIAFIYYKQKKYDIARSGFNALLLRYDTTGEGMLPPQFRILSNIILSKIEEQETAGKKKTS